MTELKLQLIADAKKKLEELGISYSCPDRDGIHIIINWEERIDLWPTTGTWRRGNQKNTSMSLLWKLLSNEARV